MAGELGHRRRQRQAELDQGGLEAGLVDVGLEVALGVGAGDVGQVPPDERHLVVGPCVVLSATTASNSTPRRRCGPPSTSPLLDVRLPAGRSVTLPAPPGRSAFALAIRGDGRVGRGATPLPADDAVGFADATGEAVRLTAGADGLHAVVAGGAPLRLPVHWIGGVAMTTRERADAAAHRHRTGRMGHPDPSF